VDRRRALIVLGLDADVDLAGLKRRFRALARDLHPDRGGDPSAFHDLQSAYEVLRTTFSDGPAIAAAPQVARGRPSRDDDPEGPARRLDEHPLGAEAQALARRLMTVGTSRSVSRAPGSRLNRVAASLALGTASTLDARLARRPTPDASCTVHIQLTVRSRSARRALAALETSTIRGAAWSRRRGWLRMSTGSPAARRPRRPACSKRSAGRWRCGAQHDRRACADPAHRSGIMAPRSTGIPPDQQEDARDA
jgi:hypothetical protein